MVNEVARELLKRQKAPAPVAPLPGAEETAIQIAQSWTGIILNPAFAPPREAVYVPFHAETGKFDILRVWYPTRLGEVLIAQTFCAFSVVMQGGPRDVNVIAKQIFQQKDRIRLKTSGADGAVSYGEQPAPAAETHRDWMGHLRWWTDGETLGFVTLKTSETPGRAMMGWDAEINRYWFRSYRQAGRDKL